MCTRICTCIMNAIHACCWFQLITLLKCIPVVGLDSPCGLMYTKHFLSRVVQYGCKVVHHIHVESMIYPALHPTEFIPLIGSPLSALLPLLPALYPISLIMLFLLYSVPSVALVLLFSCTVSHLPPCIALHACISLVSIVFIKLICSNKCVALWPDTFYYQNSALF